MSNALLTCSRPALLGFALASLLALGPRQAPAEPSQAPQGPPDAAVARLVEALRQQSVHLDPEAGALWIPVRVEVRDELLEYLLVGKNGAAHESLFSTDIQGSVLNTALLALGVEKGTNATWRPREPRPSEEEQRAGVAPYEVTLPRGDALELRIAWRQGEDLFLYRVEDLLRNLLTSASMQRHGWIYLGSRMIPKDPRKEATDKTELFAADVYQNLINISYFGEGNTLLTAALPECVEQTIWLPNAWLLPQRGAEVALILSRGRLDALPASLAASLPQVDPAMRDARKAAGAGDRKGGR